VRDRIRDKYFINKFDTISHIPMDIVFCIRVDLFNKNILTHLKKTFPNAFYTLYFWDSCKNMRSAEVVSSFFDRVYTFDLNDYMAHKEKGWKFRPLFYVKEYEQLSIKKDTEPIDLLYVASLSKERAAYYVSLKKYCDDNNLRLDAYFFCKPNIFLWNRLFSEEWKAIPKNIVHYKGMSRQELIRRFEKTKVVFDCSHKTQSGLTMRTIECFGASKRMITTNEQIMGYDFYNDKNIYILRDADFSGVKEYIDNDEMEIADSALRYKYSIKGWLEEILCQE
jgi:hypothetical protein